MYILNSKFKTNWFINNPYVTIISVCILARLIVLFFYQHINFYPDSTGYIYLAKKLLKLSLDGYNGQRTPGYPLLLAISSNNFMIVILLQNVCGIITSIFLFKLLLLLNFGKRNSLILTLISVAYLPIIFFEYCILSESLTLLVVTQLFYFLFKIIYSDCLKKNNYIFLILLSSFLVLIKPFYIFVPFVVLFILFLCSQGRQFIFLKVLIIVIPSLVLTGWCSLNYANTGYFTPTTFYGFNIAQNCVSFAEKTSPEYKDIGDIYAKYRKWNEKMGQNTAMSVWQAYNELRGSTKLSFVDLSNLLYDYSKITIKENPSEYLKQVSISWSDFWKTSLYWQYDNFAIKHVNSVFKVICYAERILLQIIKIIFILFIPYNLYKRKLEDGCISPSFIISIVILLASLLQAFASYGTNSRFSFPFETLMVASVVMNVYYNFKKLKLRP